MTTFRLIFLLGLLAALAVVVLNGITHAEIHSPSRVISMESGPLTSD